MTFTIQLAMHFDVNNIIMDTALHQKCLLFAIVCYCMESVQCTKQATKITMQQACTNYASQSVARPVWLCLNHLILVMSIPCWDENSKF